MQAAKSPGHLFVTHGDLCQLALDDVLVPCDTDLNVTSSFAPLLGASVPGDNDWIRPAGHSTPQHFTHADRRPLLISQEEGAPRVWLINSAFAGVGLADKAALGWLLAGLRSALATIESFPVPPLHQRARRTIGIPMIGVGEGGFDGMRDDVIRQLLAELTQAVRQPGQSDIVVVAWQRSDYAAIQQHRPQPTPPPMVTGGEVDRLARLAMNGDLVAFIGAGVGRSAGLPDWNQLLEALAAQTKWDHDMRGAILRLPPEDAAEALKKELRDGLQDLIVAAVSAERYGLSHSLLASMRMREVVTTNYDDLFERACARPHDGNLKVLPRQRVTGRQPWLLKLHGDAAVPESIVLTRSQYLDFDTRSAPLAAVVQANMVTRHMLFVGYSLSDNNFIRLAHQVQDLFGQYGDANELLGTVITLAPSPAASFLWKDNLQYVAVAEMDSKEGSRQTEILLDCIGRAACDEAPYVLDHKYGELLSDEDRRLAESLKSLAEAAQEGHESQAWIKVRRLLADLGGGEDSR